MAPLVVPFADRVPVHIPAPLLVDDAMPRGGHVLDRILAVAATLQALDPTLGASLRAYRTTSASDEKSTQAYRLVFTHDTHDTLSEGVTTDTRAMDFFEACEQKFGRAFAELEAKNLHSRIRWKDGVPEAGGRVVEAALLEGFAKGVLQMHAFKRDDGRRHDYSSVVAVPPEAYMGYPDLAHIVLHTTPDTGANFDDPIVRKRARLSQVKDILAKPFEAASIKDRETVKATIGQLNNMVESGSFEEDMRHGWVGYALSKRASGWTGFLVNQVEASPYAPYGEFAPITLATAMNDDHAARTLLQAGVSANTVLSGYPRIFKGIGQEQVSAHGGNFVPLLVYATAVRSRAVMGALLHEGADPNMATDKQDTALHMAAMWGDDQAVRLLLRHDANAVTTNAAGQRPESLVPADSIYDSVNDVLVDAAQARLGQQPIPAPEPIPVSTIQARELWSGTSRRRPGM